MALVGTDSPRISNLEPPRMIAVVSTIYIKVSGPGFDSGLLILQESTLGLDSQDLIDSAIHLQWITSPIKRPATRRWSV
jgi:hypothetical protein